MEATHLGIAHYTLCPHSHQTQGNEPVFISALGRNILTESIPLCCENIRIYYRHNQHTFNNIINKC
jgi:hypothetical protein